MKISLLVLLLSLSALGCASCDPAGCGASVPPPPERVLFQFGHDADLSAWEIQDDDVMGGRSQGAFALNEAGNLVFSGTVSIENDGGFSSLQYGFDPIDVSQHRAIVIGLKGDGKRYQVRIESKSNARHSYAYDFQTSGGWQAIEIPFAEMYAIHHGDRLDLPNYPGQTLAHFQLLIGNGAAETFQIELDKIWLK